MIKIALSNIFKKFSLTITTIFSLTITLFICSFMFSIYMNLNHVAEKIDQGFKVVVNIDPKLSKTKHSDEFINIETNILKTQHVKSFKFSSKSEELATLFDSDTTNELSKSLNGDNPLSDTYYVSVDSEKNLESVATNLRKINHVQSALYGGDVVKDVILKLHSWENVMFIAIAILVLISVLLMMNIIRVAIINQKEAIEIMRLVGASNNYIRMPYVIESWIVSFISVILSSVMLYFVLRGGYQAFNVFSIADVNLIDFNLIFVWSVLVSLGTAFVISLLSSFITIRRFIKI